MTEREKVIKAFEFCLMPPSREELENDICSHEDCPYYREYNGGKCVSAAAADALALLKAQEPMEPNGKKINVTNASFTKVYTMLWDMRRAHFGTSVELCGMITARVFRNLRISEVKWRVNDG